MVFLVCHPELDSGSILLFWFWIPASPIVVAGMTKES